VIDCVANHRTANPKVVVIFGLGEIARSLREWLGRPGEVARRDRLRPNVAVEAEHEAVHAF